MPRLTAVDVLSISQQAPSFGIVVSNLIIGVAVRDTNRARIADRQPSLPVGPEMNGVCWARDVGAKGTFQRSDTRFRA